MTRRYALQGRIAEGTWQSARFDEDLTLREAQRAYRSMVEDFGADPRKWRIVRVRYDVLTGGRTQGYAQRRTRRTRRRSTLTRKGT